MLKVHHVKLLAGALCCLMLCLPVGGGVPAKEWRGIIPLHSTRADVRKLLGQPLPISSKFSDSYDVAEGRAHFMYVRQRCEQGLPADWGNWDVPPETVANITIYLAKEMPLKELNIPDIEKYEWYTDDTLTTYYHDKKEGVQYSARDGMVRSITYGPREKDRHLLCKKDAPVIRY